MGNPEDFRFIPDPKIRGHQLKLIKDNYQCSIFEADDLWVEERKKRLLARAKQHNAEGRPQDAIDCMIKLAELKSVAVG